VSLCEGEESLLVVPASSPLLEEKLPVNRVVMKAGRSLERVRELLGDRAVLVENCGMEEERIVPLWEAESAGYFATVLQCDPSSLK
jgi:precorrin-2 methylase